MAADIGFDDKVAVITGAGGGLGRCHALEFARRGARVVVNDLGGAIDGSGGGDGPAQQVVNEITELGGEAVANTDSVATPEGGQGIVKSAIDAFGKVDIVVNNAGILRDKSFAKMDSELWNPVVDVHLNGAYHVTAAAWPHMKEQNYGRIINTSSNSGVLGNFGQANYGAAKMGLVGFTNVLAIEGAKNNIKTNAIAPVALTRMTEEMFGAMGEKLQPEMVTPIVIFLAHEDCPVTGEVYSAAGGVISRFFVGNTTGFFDAELTPESVRDNFETIRDESGYEVYPDSSGELGKLLKMLG